MTKTGLLPQMLLLYLFILPAIAEEAVERIGNRLGDPGPLYHDDQNLVNQVILINPSQQVQSAHLLITKWNVMWDYLNTEAKLQLWKKQYSQSDDLTSGYFTLQQETQLLKSNSTGRVSFPSYILANHGDVLGIYFKTQNPIPYRRRLGACADPRERVWRLDKQLEPVHGETHMFMAAQVNDLCREYLIEPEFSLVDYAIPDPILLGSLPVERPNAETEQTEITVLDPSITLPSRSRILGWKAYFIKPLTKVQFAVFSPAGGKITSPGGGLFNLTYISEEYFVSEPGPFYARIDYISQKMVLGGSVFGLKYLKENPIPYTLVDPCLPESHILYSPLVTGIEYYTEHYTMVERTTTPCRQYSVQLVYDERDAPYPEECEPLNADTGTKEATSGWYHKADGIHRDSTKECWVIQGTAGQDVIHLEVHNLDLTTSHSCVESGLNILEIRDGDSLQGNLLRTVCPGETSVIVTGCTSTMHLYLRSTDSITKKGLRFSYRTVSQAPDFCRERSSAYSSTSTVQRSILSVILLCIGASTIHPFI